MVSNLPDAIFADAVNQAAALLLAISYRPELKPSLVAEVTAAVVIFRDERNGQRLTKFDLRAVLEAIVARALEILAAALQERLPGVADEVDESFGEKLWILLGSVAQLFPAL
jgi:hypothetical protein